MITQIRGRSQVTIPNEIVKMLDLKAGDNIDISVDGNKIVITPVMVVAKDQAWYWSKEWQEGEKEADNDKVAGKTKSFTSVDGLMEELNADQ